MKLVKDFGVRALLGSIIVAPATACLVVLALNGSSEAMTGLVAMATGVTGYYFGQRGNS